MREKRVPIMMTVEEMTQIDDWSFANRVATRSVAVRRLCKMGIDSKKNETPSEFERLMEANNV